MAEKGFTATFISNRGKKLHRYNVSGWKLYLARVLMAFVVLLLSTAFIMVAYGLINAGETERMRNEISRLQDSLAVRRNIEARLEIIEDQIQQLHEQRRRLENITAGIPTSEDSLEQ